MQFQVPQFIETEDKIVGPFTLRQFAYIASGAIVCAALYFTVQTWLAIIGSILILGIVLALAFIRIEGRPLANIALSAFSFYWKPQTYVWQPEHAAVISPPQKKEEENSSALEDILKKSEVKKQRPIEKPATRESASAGSALHKIWENVQTGAPLGKKNSDRQFIERKTAERYQIFQRTTGERKAAKRIDYR